MGMLPDQFLFVNKSAHSKSLSHSQKGEKFDIYSHVHGKYHKDKTQCKGRSKHQLSISPSTHPCKLVTNGVTRKAKSTCVKRSQPAVENLHKSHVLLNGSAVDPFMCSSVSIDSKEQNLLYYPFKNFLETTFRAESLVTTTSCVKFRHRDAVTERLQRCVVDDLTMYSTLAYCASCMRWSIGDEEPERPAEMYIIKAIEVLRHRLRTTQKPDIWIILGIYALAVAEMWAQNYEAATAHLKMTGHFAMQLGGLTKLEPYLMESIILCDKYVAIGKFETPILPLDWQPEPLPKHQMADIYLKVDPALHVLARGFFDLDSDILGHGLLTIINDAAICTKVAEYLEAQQNIDPGSQRWLFLRHQALVCRALAFQPASVTQDCTRIALIVWLLKVTVYFGAQRWSRKLLPRLRAALMGIGTRCSSQISPLLLWVVSLGAMTAEYTDEREWFLERTVALASRLHLELEKNPFRQFLQRFLFVKVEDGLQFFRMLRAAQEIQAKI